MSLSTPQVLYMDNGDGSADFTITFADDDYKFSASTDGDTAVLSYDETLSWRGEIRVSEPDETVFKELMQSDEMTQFLEENELRSVKRERR